MITIYAIKNCNTVKKALNWLDENNINYDFHDYKKLGGPKDKLAKFIDKFGIGKIINKKGMTWRQLDKARQEKITNKDAALNLMLEKTSIIKRPIIDDGKNQLIGFDEAAYKDFFSK